MATSACAVGAWRLYELVGTPSPRPPPPFTRRPSPGLTNVLEVQVVVEELVLLEVGVLGRVHVVYSTSSLILRMASTRMESLSSMRRMVSSMRTW